MRPHKVNGLTDEERLRRCSSKGRWPDAVSATASALYALEQEDRPGGLFYYQCPHCRGWHLTKQPQPGQEPVRLSDFTEKTNK